MNKSDLAYLGGLFDGEGSAGLYRFWKLHSQRKRKYLTWLPECQLKMTDKEPVEFIHKHFPNFKIQTYKLPSKKTVYMWMLTYRSALQFAVKILPYCKNATKKEQLQRIINHYSDPK